ncbi:MAG: RibD family protein [Pseudomonadota bacterium]
MSFTKQDQHRKSSTIDPIAAITAESKLVVGQLGQSLDGRIATRTGDSKYINHACGLKHLHRLRAAVDAVVVGVGTVNADDPQLTVRHCDGQSPVRVIIDPNGRAFAQSQLFHDAGPPVVVIVKNGVRYTAPDHVEIIDLEASNDRLDPLDIVYALAERGLNRLLIEGGSRTLSAFIDRGCLDRLHLIVAPIILGTGYPGLTLSAISKVDAALRPEVTSHHLDKDMLFDCDLR